MIALAWIVSGALMFAALVFLGEDERWKTGVGAFSAVAWLVGLGVLAGA